MPLFVTSSNEAVWSVVDEPIAAVAEVDVAVEAEVVIAAEDAKNPPPPPLLLQPIDEIAPAVRSPRTSA
jgi:hypothetical protein